MYNWPNVAQRTEAVYRAALAAPAEQDALLPRLRRYRSIGSWAGLLFCCVVVLLHWFWRLLEWQQPADCVEPAADWPGIAQMLRCSDSQQQQKAQQQQQNSGRSAQQAGTDQLGGEQLAAAPIQGATPPASGGSRRYNLRSSARQDTS
jgi:phosphatidylinositol glycan class A protein